MAGSAETVEFWCHDCRDDCLFEVLPEGGEEVARGWACVMCGAAYVGAFDVAIEIEADVRGVA
ncbi:MAG: hypothetical protein LH645_06490 [Actinomycetia bacterium]|nr:hypothetical protein [Actinomycetes bacterium]